MKKTYVKLILATLISGSNIVSGYAVTTIDVATQLPWTASGTSTAAGTVAISGTTTALSSSNTIKLDAPGAWTVVNNGSINTTAAAISSSTAGSTYNFTNNGTISSTAQALFLDNAGDTSIINNGIMETTGTSNTDPLDVFFAGTGNNLSVYNYGMIHATVSNAMEIHNPNTAYVYNGASGTIKADGRRFAVYVDNLHGDFSLVNDGNIVNPNTSAVSVASAVSQTTTSIVNNGTITSAGLYYGQTMDDVAASPQIVPYLTSVYNSSAGNITVTSNLMEFSSTINNLTVVNDGVIKSNYLGIYMNRNLSTQGLYGTFTLENSGILSAGLGLSAAGPVYINTLGSAAAVNIANSGQLEGYSFAINVLNADSSTPVVINNETGGTISSAAPTSTTSAIRISKGDIEIQNDGTISSAGGAAINLTGTSTATIVSSGNISGGTYGIAAQNSGTDVTVTQTAGSITGGTTAIATNNSGTGTTTISVAGTVAGGTGAGILTSTPTGNTVAVNLNSGADVSAISGLAVYDYLGNATLTMESGSKLAGQVLLGEGNDAMIIKGTADISDATLLDGGNSTDSTVTDILGTSGAATNKLIFQGTTQSIAGSIMKNWQTVALDNSNVTFAGDAALVTGTGTNGDGSLQGLVLTNTSTINSPVTLAVTGDVNIDGTSTLNHALGGTISGDMTNAGLVNWNGDLGNTLTINGNYTGVSGSKLSLGTYLGDDSSATDKLNVTGNTSGNSTLIVRPVSGSLGAQTTVGIDVIQVGDTSAGIFTLGNALQAGAYQYVLKQGGNGGTANDWYLISEYQKPATPTVPIYRPGTANYVASQTANAEQGFDDLSTLHQRISEQRGVRQSTTQENSPLWARTYYDNDNNKGDRFGYGQHISGIQVGYELKKRVLEDGTKEGSGVELHYSRGSSNFTDSKRTLVNLQEQTGSMKADSVGIGGYYTRMKTNGNYVDLVGQVSRLHNRFEDSYADTSTQNGWRLGLSAEVGRAINHNNGWTVEPQAQLSYLNSSYSGFNDSISRIDSYHTASLRGRLGVRIYKEPVEANGKQVYGIINVVHDFLNPVEVTVDGTRLDDRFAKTYWEIGAGAQQTLNRDKKDVFIYGDVRYRRSFDGNKHGYMLNAGIKREF